MTRTRRRRDGWEKGLRSASRGGRWPAASIPCSQWHGPWTLRSHVKAHYRAGAGFGDFPNCLKQLQLSLKRSASVWSPWSPLDNVQGPSAVAAHLFQQEGLSSDGASGTSVREGRARGQQSGSVSGVPGSLLEIQVPGSLTRSAESETLGAGLNDLYVSQFRQ